MSKFMTLWTFFTTKKKFNSRKEIERNQEKKMLKHIKKFVISQNSSQCIGMVLKILNGEIFH